MVRREWILGRNLKVEHQDYLGTFLGTHWCDLPLPSMGTLVFIALEGRCICLLILLLKVMPNVAHLLTLLDCQKQLKTVSFSITVVPILGCTLEWHRKLLKTLKLTQHPWPNQNHWRWNPSVSSLYTSAGYPIVQPSLRTSSLDSGYSKCGQWVNSNGIPWEKCRNSSPIPDPWNQICVLTRSLGDS